MTAHTSGAASESRPARGPRHSFLRQATASLHAEVEAVVERAKMFDSVERYGDYLRRLTVFHERLLSAQAVASPATLPHWQHVREHVAALAEDLGSLSLRPTATRSSVAVASSATAALGALYVVVGSSLGARVLVRRAATMLSSAEGRAPCATAYLSAQASSNDWPAFLRVLESEPITTSAELAAGANGAFACMLDVLTLRLAD